MRFTRVIAIGAVALALAACTTKEVSAPASTAAGTGSNSTVATAPTSKPTTTTTTKAGTAHVGAALSLVGADGAKADVTLTQVINPATGAAGPPTDSSGNPSGAVYVSTLITIKNTGSTALQGDANNDSTLIGSNNQSYSADFDSVNECTDFNSGSYQIGVGESATGCVTYVLPAGVTPVKFQYSPSSGFSNNFGEWLIP